MQRVLNAPVRNGISYLSRIACQTTDVVSRSAEKNKVSEVMLRKRRGIKFKALDGVVSSLSSSFNSINNGVGKV